MALEYQIGGTLRPGVYDLSWDEFKGLFGYNEHRQKLLIGLELAVDELRAVGCKKIYADGSFIMNNEPFPNDFDICWNEEGVNLSKLRACYPGLIDYGFRMKNMKKRYGGDIVPMNNHASMETGITFFGFFQEDKQGREKGIIGITLI